MDAAAGLHAGRDGAVDTRVGRRLFRAGVGALDGFDGGVGSLAQQRRVHLGRPRGADGRQGRGVSSGHPGPEPDHVDRRGIRRRAAAAVSILAARRRDRELDDPAGLQRFQHRDLDADDRRHLSRSSLGPGGGFDGRVGGVAQQRHAGDHSATASGSHLGVGRTGIFDAGRRAGDLVGYRHGRTRTVAVPILAAQRHRRDLDGAAGLQQLPHGDLDTFRRGILSRAGLGSLGRFDGRMGSVGKRRDARGGPATPSIDHVHLPVARISGFDRPAGDVVGDRDQRSSAPAVPILALRRHGRRLDDPAGLRTVQHGDLDTCRTRVLLRPGLGPVERFHRALGGLEEQRLDRGGRGTASARVDGCRLGPGEPDDNVGGGQPVRPVSRLPRVLATGAARTTARLGVLRGHGLAAHRQRRRCERAAVLPGVRTGGTGRRRRRTGGGFNGHAADRFRARPLDRRRGNRPTKRLGGAVGRRRRRLPRHGRSPRHVRRSFRALCMGPGGAERALRGRQGEPRFALRRFQRRRAYRHLHERLLAGDRFVVACHSSSWKRDRRLHGRSRSAGDGHRGLRRDDRGRRLRQRRRRRHLPAALLACRRRRTQLAAHQ